MKVILLGLILSADSFSAAVAMGFRPFKRSDALKFAFASGFAEALVTAVGYFAGSAFISSIAAYDHWVAFGLLGIVSLNMAYEGIQGLRNKGEEEENLEFHSFGKVLMVSFATSLDALGVGIGLGVAHEAITPYLVSIGFWAFAGTIAGLYLARKLSSKFGPIITIIGSIILGFMAFEMLKI
jgi:manganese efflux pump family protein